MIVTGMEMPESCSDCPICHSKGKDDPWNYYCSATMNDIDVQEWNLTRHDDCPLRSVEGLIEQIRRQEFAHFTDNGGYYMTPAEIKDVLETIIKKYCGLEE